MPKTAVFFAIGLLASSIASGLAGLFYFLAIMNFVWYMGLVYGALIFVTLYLLFIAYAMFKAALIGEENEPDGPSTY